MKEGSLVNIQTEQIPDSLQWRLVGPHRGGRSVAVAGHPTDAMTFYFGSTGGGVWKTTNGGITWDNISDGYFNTASVGALQIAESDPNVIYAGMGECCIRGNVSFGDGVYKTRDGGETWQSMGLADTRHIARIRIHPKDPNLVYVAALGHAFGPNPDRGVFRSRDGGQTWEKILYRDDATGAIDLTMDPNNPRILYAALWQARRMPWAMVSGGPGSGLFKSTDGGDSWEELTHKGGLPEGVWGRVGVTLAPTQPKRVWAMVEAEQGGLYRSDDGGQSWDLVNQDREIRARPWYYTHVFADPKDPQSVSILATGFWHSDDGGKHFHQVATPHGDHHDLWIDPKNPARQIHGADGGGTVSFDGGHSWSNIYNQPTGEFYHVMVDTNIPYRLYGAQQDNTTISVPSRTRHAAISQREWFDIGGAESGYIAVRPDDPNIVYAGSSGGGEGGRITRYDHRTREQRDISPWPEKTAGMASQDYTYRFQWTTPIVLSPHDPNTLYVAGNRIFATRNEGRSWTLISPDLTKQDATKFGPSGGPITKDHTGVEVYGTVFALAESPLQPGLLWAGTDDGLIHVSHDAGESWTNVTPPELPEWSLISLIEASRFHAGTAYVAATRYKLDDPRPSLWRTRDFGGHWEPIVAGLPKDAYTRVIREDSVAEELLFVGTERGMYVSLDQGDHWVSLQLNLPRVPIHDIQVVGDDIVVATHGRSFWILDKGSPLRQLLEPDTSSAAMRLFRPSPAYRAAPGGTIWFPKAIDSVDPVAVLEWPTGASFYVKKKPAPGDPPFFLDAGQNPVYGVIFHYWLEQDETAPVVLQITNARGDLVQELRSDSTHPNQPKLEGAKGFHRVTWNLRYPEATRLEDGDHEIWETVAPLVVPGIFKATLVTESRSVSQDFEVLADPRVDTTRQDFEAQWEFVTVIKEALSAVHESINRLRRTKADVSWYLDRAQKDSAYAGLVSQGHAIIEHLSGIEAELIQVHMETSLDDLQYPPKLNAKIAYLASVVESGDWAPTEQVRAAFEHLNESAQHWMAELDAYLGSEIPAFSEALRQSGMPLVRTTLK